MQRRGVVLHADALGKRIPSTFIDGVIGVEHHLPFAVLWNPEAIVGNGRARKVAYGEQSRAVCTVADITKDVIGRVICFDPLEAILVEILAPQCWGIAVDEVDIPYEALDAVVPFATPTVEVAPVYGIPLGPLGSLAKFLDRKSVV